MGRTLITVLCASVLLTIGITTDEQLCPSSQILELGENGIIRCSFPNGYFGIYWYDTQDLTQQPLLHSEDGKKGGNGLGSGGFDLAPDGSLLVNLVTIDLERMFTVVLLESHQSQNLIQHTISVRVFAHPALPYPVIIQCTNRQYCYTELRSDDKLECTVNDARPPVHLSWVVRTSEGDSDVSFQRTYSTTGSLSTTTATIHSQQFSTLHFQLFVCKAKQNTLILDNLASFVLVELDHPDSNLVKLTAVVPVIGDLLTLNCDGDDILYFIWKKVISEIKYDVIAHGYITAGTYFSKPPYILDHDGTLMIIHVSHEEKGVYVCYSSNGIQETIASYNVTIVPLGSTPIVTTGIGIVQVISIQNNKPVAAFLIPIFLVTLMVVVAVLVIVRRRNMCTSDTENPVGEETSSQLLPRSEDNQQVSNHSEEHPLMDNNVGGEGEEIDTLEDHDINQSPVTTADKKKEEETVISDENEDTQDHDIKETVDKNESLVESENQTLSKSLPPSEEHQHLPNNSEEGPLTTADNREEKETGTVDENNETQVHEKTDTVDEKESCVKSVQHIGQSELSSTEVHEGRDILSNATLKQKGNPSIYIIDCNETDIQLLGMPIKNYEVGDSSNGRQVKTIVILGTTGVDWIGSINNLVNCFVGVKWEDDFRYELGDLEESQRTRVITWISICASRGKLKFDVTIIYLPCFNESSETTYTTMYHHISEQIIHLTTFDNKYKLSQIDAIVPLQKYSPICPALHNIFRIFGNDLRDNIYIFSTCDSVNEYFESGENNSQIQNHFAGQLVFNNMLLFSQKGNEENDTISKRLWGKSRCNFDKFLDSLNKSSPIDFKGSIEIHSQRSNLAKMLSEIKDKTKDMESNSAKLKSEEAHLTTLENNVTVTLQTGVKAMNCGACKNTLAAIQT